jgi:type 1 glutamine amidotransferase
MKIRSLVLVSILSLAFVAGAADVRPLRVLLITGGCCHTYGTQKDILKKGLEARANVEVTQVHTDDNTTKARFDIYEKPDWARGYDLVIHDECSADVTNRSYVQNILDAHAGGIPAMNLHCAMHCYRTGTNIWFQFVGIQSTGHGPQEPIELQFVEPAHITTQGFTNWTTIREELYNNVKIFPTAQPLARGRQTYKNKDGKEESKESVVAWVNEYGPSRTRVFSTTIGHNDKTVGDPRYLALLTRGLLWACGKLDAAGDPQPGYGPPPPTAATASAAAGEQKFPSSEQPVALFNGKNLEGWEGNMTYWSVQDGVVVGKNTIETAPKASTYLTTTKKFRNFRLVFEGKLATSEMHSGISLWGESVEKEMDPHSYKGHLVMFPSNWGYWDLYGRNSIYKDDGRAKKAGHQHDWNQMEILAIGSRIRFAVNGQLVADWTDPKPELCQPGAIGLQLHSNKVAQEVQFRGLLLSENPEDRMITTQQ